MAGRRRRPPPLSLLVPLLCPPPPPSGPLPDLPPGRVFFQSYGSERGLLNLAEQSFAADTEGFLWTGAQEGLFRYDGSRFERYGLDEGLPSAYITFIAAGPGGALYVGTWNGLAIRKAGRFRAIGPDAGLPAATVHSIATAEDGRLWVASKAGLYREVNEGRFEPVSGFPGNEATGLFIDKDGGVFVGRDGAVDHLTRDGQWQTYGAAEGIAPGPVIGIARGRRGILWIHSRSRLWAMSSTGTIEDRSCLLPTGSSEGGISLTAAGDVLIPTARGIFRITPEGADILDRRRGLPTDESFAAFEDREGSLWVASVGVHRLRGRGLWSAYTTAEGLPNDVIYSIARGPDGRLWVGTDDGLARSGDLALRAVPGTEGHSFRSLNFAPDGALWGAGSPGKLLRIDPLNLSIRSYGSEQGLKGSQIMGFTRDQSGRFWVGMRSGGLFLGTPSGPDGDLHFEPYSLPGGIPEEEIDWIFSDHRGRVWAAGERGLAVINGDRVRRFTTADGLRGDHVTGVMQRRSGEICVEYFEPLGMSCFREEGDSLVGARHLGMKEGLPSNKVYFLGEDHSDRLWAGTAAGVGVIVEGRVRDVFLQSDGTPGDDSDAMAFWADPGGDVWIGTSTGLGRFAGAHYKGPPDPPRSRIASAAFGDLQFSEPFPGSIRVPFGSGSLDIRFSSPSFVNEARVSQELRLVGLDEAWHTSAFGEERYGGLGPGLYRIEVRSRFGGGDPGPVASLSFEILPAFWQTLWARGAGIALLAAAIAGGVRLRLRALSRRNEELSRLVSARTAELRAAQEKVVESEKLSALGRLLAQLSHELNNPINVISNNVDPMRAYLDDLSAAIVELKAYAADAPGAQEKVDALFRDLDLDFVIDDFGKALGVVATAAGRVRGIHADLRAFMRSGATEKSPGDLGAALRESALLASRGLPPGVTLIERYEPLPELSFHAGQINQVVTNLLNNAIDAVRGEGTITLSARLIPGFVEISIEDSGSGVPESIRARIFEPFFTTKDVGKGTGLGLAICREIVVTHHGGSIELDPSLSGGARFLVRLPLAEPDHSS